MKNNLEFINSLWQKKQAKRVLDFYVKQCENRKQVLDINSNNPLFLNMLSEKGFEVSTIASKAIKQDIANSIKQEKGTLRNIKSKNKYDVISIMNFEIERLSNYLELDRCFANLKKHLNNNGIIIIDFLKPKNLKTYGTIEDNRELTLLKYRGKSRKAVVLNVYKDDKQTVSFKQKLKIYSLKKLRQIANKNELDIAFAFDNFSENVANEHSARIQLVLKKAEVLPDKVKKQHKKQVVTKKGKIKEVSKKTLAVTMLMVVVGAGLCGSWFGNMYIMNFLSTPAYDSYSESSLRDDVSKIYWQNKTPDMLTPTQAYVVAESQLTNSDKNWSLTKKGDIKNTFANQTVSGSASFDGTTIIQNSISLGFKNVASRTEYVVGNSSVNVASGTPKDETVESVVWNNASEENQYGYTERLVDDYRNDWGVAPDKVYAYIVSSKTVLSQTEWEKVGDNYKATISLHKESSVILYVKQMKQISGLSSAPVFEEIQLTFILDKDYNFISISSYEKYTMRVGISVACEGTLDINFTYN